jgi:hypothetical protein
MDQTTTAEHPCASAYEQAAREASELRYDGLIPPEQCRSMAASFMITVEESETLARAAEHAQRIKEYMND